MAPLGVAGFVVVVVVPDDELVLWLDGGARFGRVESLAAPDELAEDLFGELLVDGRGVVVAAGFGCAGIGPPDDDDDDDDEGVVCKRSSAGRSIRVGSEGALVLLSRLMIRGIK